MDLQCIGWTPERQSELDRVVGTTEETDFGPGRISEEHKGSYRVLTRDGELRAEVSGRLLYEADGPAELPSVGDFVVLSARPEEEAATIHGVLERSTSLVRKAPERPANAQVLAANIDEVWIVTSLNRDLNPRRIERMLTLVAESGASPVLVLSKTDLVSDCRSAMEVIDVLARELPVFAVSALAGTGVEGLEARLDASPTVALLGSSGVGKSTLVNRMLRAPVLATGAIREDDARGRHTTSHRQLVPLPRGGALIDTPGLREVALYDDGGGLDEAFPELLALSARCRFGDCRHEGEPGCAVREAIDTGELEPARLESYRKLGREVRFMEERRDARGRHEQRKRARKFTRSIRNRPDKRRPRR